MNTTAGAIKQSRALVLARSVFGDTFPDVLLVAILWRETRYPREKSEARLLEDLETYKRGLETAVNADEMKMHMQNFGTDETPPPVVGGFLAARGIFADTWDGEPAEVTIRRLRDGDGTVLISDTDYRKLHVIANDHLLEARGEFVEEMPLSEILDKLEAALVERKRLQDEHAAMMRLASISAWGCVWFNTTEPPSEDNYIMDMYRVEIHETDVGGERLAHESGNDLVDTIERALLAYEAVRFKPSMEAGMKWAEKRLQELGLLDSADSAPTDNGTRENGGGE